MEFFDNLENDTKQISISCMSVTNGKQMSSWANSINFQPRFYLGLLFFNGRCFAIDLEGTK